MFKSPFRNNVCITIVNGLSTAKPKCILVLLLDKFELSLNGKPRESEVQSLVTEEAKYAKLIVVTVTKLK